MAAVVSAGMKMGVFMVMLIPALYQVITFTILFSKQPTTTTTVSAPVPYEQFNEILVCTSDWTTLNSPLTEDGAAYLAGYSTTNDLSRFGPKSEVFRQIGLDEEALNRSRSEYKKVFGGRNAAEVIANISTLSALQFKDSAGSVKKIRVPVTLHYTSIKLACGYIPRYKEYIPENSLLHNENAEGSLNDNPEFWFLMDMNGLLVQGNQEHVNYVSLFSTENFPFFRVAKHFIDYTYENREIGPDGAGSGGNQATEGGDAMPNGPADTEKPEGQEGTATASTGGAMVVDPDKKRGFDAKDIILKIDINRNSYIQTRKSKCLNETGNRNPTDFLHRMCAIECEEKAFNDIYGCTTFTFLQHKNTSNLPPCHLYDSQLPGKVDPFPSIDVDTDETEMMRVKEACVAERECDTKRHCEEYDIAVRSITIGESVSEMRASTFDDRKQVLHRVKLVLPDKVVVAQEQLQIDIETWIGTVGGIIGIYLGWSLITLFDALSSAWAWVRGRRRKNGEDRLNR